MKSLLLPSSVLLLFFAPAAGLAVESREPYQRLIDNPA